LHVDEALRAATARPRARRRAGAAAMTRGANVAFDVGSSAPKIDLKEFIVPPSAYEPASPG
jgi:hypothetical protein